ncbi:predicted protein [Streptomyces viridochromogenes DSM 40736]|uniref:Predicted protein n=1 Tax=Streptomyces viridochromogenes (strain DSM 40736 / JCM 4977 / BCRC 1201 / Tue 494) TaxID=591159 RepID=D9X4H2_STRVT|nr:predicted protein [Streptomyces viridochromogenes DSM 40736]
MTALHSGTFAGAPATGKRVKWDEIGVLHFDDPGQDHRPVVHVPGAEPRRADRLPGPAALSSCSAPRGHNSRPTSST